MVIADDEMHYYQQVSADDLPEASRDFGLNEWFMRVVFAHVDIGLRHVSSRFHQCHCFFFFLETRDWQSCFLNSLVRFMQLYV